MKYQKFLLLTCILIAGSSNALHSFAPADPTNLSLKPAASSQTANEQHIPAGQEKAESTSKIGQAIPRYPRSLCYTVKQNVFENAGKATIQNAVQNYLSQHQLVLPNAAINIFLFKIFSKAKQRQVLVHIYDPLDTEKTTTLEQPDKKTQIDILITLANTVFKQITLPKKTIDTLEAALLIATASYQAKTNTVDTATKLQCIRDICTKTLPNQAALAQKLLQESTENRHICDEFYKIHAIFQTIAMHASSKDVLYAFNKIYVSKEHNQSTRDMITLIQPEFEQLLNQQLATKPEEKEKTSLNKAIEDAQRFIEKVYDNGPYHLMLNLSAHE